MTDRTALLAAKAELRATMRRWRRGLDDRAARSERLWGYVQTVDAVAGAQRILVFDAVVGEPDTEVFRQWCQRRSVTVAVPEDDVQPSWPDLVIVPGLAFTRTGQRLGQGGGWYDRFLADVECVTVGVCFAEQVLDDLPIEAHDVAVDVVVTDAGPVWAG